MQCRVGSTLSALTFAAWIAAVLPAAAQPTVLLMHSRPGDYIGAGGNWLHTPADGSFTATKNFDNGVSLRFDGGAAVWWMVDFAAPQNAPLTPGTYDLATRYPFQAATEPGLSVSGTGRGCNMLTGRFTVLEIVYGAGTTITSFAANFEQHCEGMAAALYGSVRFNASARAAYTVAVTTAGAGGGTVTSFPIGITCGVTCTTSVADGLITALIATPAAGSTFAGWTGPADCADGVVAEGASVACGATFVPCVYSITPSSTTLGASGGSGQATVTATPGCSWTPMTTDDWIFVDPQTRSGTQPLGFTYLPRGSYSTSRTATVSVGTATFTLTQTGVTPQLTVSPREIQVPPSGGTLQVSVFSNVVDVSWTSSSNASWLSVPTGGLASAQVPITVAANLSPNSRAGTVVIAGAVVTVYQLPDGPPAKPVRFNATVSGFAGFFTWGAVTGADAYWLEAGLAPGDTQVRFTVPAPSTSYQLPQVPPGLYFLRLRAVNAKGASPATDDLALVVGPSGQSVPLAPQGFTATLVNGTLQAHWLPSANAGEVVDRYVLEASTSGGRVDVSLPVGLRTSATIPNVPTGAFVLRVRAVNAAGASLPSDEQLVVSGGAPPLPGQPQNLGGSASGSTVSLTWSPPSTGGTIVRYRVEVGSYRGATSVAVDTPDAGTALGFSGVPPGHYFIRIRAVNGQGAGLATADVLVDVP